MLTALTVLSIASPFALPFVEYDKKATLGSFFTKSLKLFTDARVMSHSCSSSGNGFNPQSANKKTPSAPISLFLVSIKKNADTVLIPSFALII